MRSHYIPVMSLTRLQPLRGRTFQTKQAMVYESLREAIMQSRLPPGERLVIDDIAAKFAVSAIPVREALQLLQAERLVEQRPHVGAVVAPLTINDAREIFALLGGLEMAVCAGAIENATGEDVAVLDELVGKMENVSDDGRWIELNQRFHRAFAEIARMPRAVEMLARVSGEWERLRRHCFAEVGRPDNATADREHRAMLQALARKDGAGLEELVRAHNRDALAFYLAAAARITADAKAR
jgi:DNA-binding GntR family transcriptional regulator